jgi:ribosomal-protein-alanine N-acetyltransferase
MADAQRGEAAPMPEDGIVVERLASDEDLDAVADLESRCFNNPWTRDMLARELAQSDVAHVFVLRLPACPVAGFCSCWIVVDELHINTLDVDIPFRRRGLGVYLMRFVIGEAVRRGVRRATLEVRESNVAARKLYEMLGFSVAGKRSRYYTLPDEDALVLWREDLPGLILPQS